MVAAAMRLDIIAYMEVAGVHVHRRRWAMLARLLDTAHAIWQGTRRPHRR